jgi:hypothetical protein
MWESCAAAPQKHDLKTIIGILICSSMEFLAELIFQLLLYTVGWAIGASILFVGSLGRIVSTKAAVNGTYERLPNGQIAANPELVCYFGVLAGFLAVAGRFFIFH